MWTTRPRTTSPSSNSVTPLSYQSSMRSSAGSPPSKCGPPRCCRGSSFFIPPVPPIILFARATAYDSNRPRPALAGGAGNNTVPEARNGVHHLTTRNLILGLPICPPGGLEPERLAERHRHLRGALQAAPLRPRATGTAHVDRHDRGAAGYREQARARLRGPNDALLAARSLREHEQRAAFLEHALGDPERAGIGAFGADRTRVEPMERRAEQRDLEELRLGQVRQLPIRGATDERRIEHARVVRHDQHRPARGDVLHPDRLEPEHEAHECERRDLAGGIQPIPRSRRAAAVLMMLDRRHQTLDHLLRGEAGCIELDRAVGLAQRRQLTRLVLLVARRELARDRRQRHRCPRRRKLGLAPPRACVERGGEVELHLGVRRHDRAGVAALEDDAALGRELSLQRRDLGAHRSQGRHIRSDLRDLAAPDRLGHVLAVEVDVAGRDHDRERGQMPAQLRALRHRDAGSHHAEGQGAVHGAGGNQRVAEPLGQHSSRRTLASPGRTVDRDDRILSRHHRSCSRIALIRASSALSASARPASMTRWRSPSAWRNASMPALSASRFARKISVHMSGSPPAMRVVSRKPRAASSSAPGSTRPAPSTSAHAIRCGRWLIAAPVRSCVSGSSDVTRAPRASHSPGVVLSAASSVFSVGVTTTVAPRKRSARATRYPACSEPASGWLPTNASGRVTARRSAVRTMLRLVEPTSVMSAPSAAAPHTRSRSPSIASTGAASRMTSASRTPAPRSVTALSSVPSSTAGRSRSRSRPTPTIRRASPPARAAFATEPPSRPTPTIASCRITRATSPAPRGAP